MSDLTTDTTRPRDPAGDVEHLRSRLQALSDVLRALSRSGLALQPILDQIVEAAARLVGADGCIVWLADGDGLLRLHASFGAPESAVEYMRQHPHEPDPGSCTGRVALTKRPAHIPDVELASRDATTTARWGA